MTVGSKSRVLAGNQGSFSKNWNGDDNPSGDRKTENGYLMEIHEWQHDLIHCWWYNGTFAWSAYTGYGVVPRYINMDPNVQLQLIGDIGEHVRGHSFNAAITLAEASESLGMVLKTTVAFYDAYKYAKRGDFENSYRSLARAAAGTTRSGKKWEAVPRRRNKTPAGVNDVADFWLSMQWGWLPLLNDIYQGMQAIAKGSPDLQREYKVRKRKTTKGIVDVDVSSGGNTVDSPARASLEYRVVYKELKLLDSLGLTDPASVIWEKIPFSCVVDWFIPIGSYFEARSFVNSLSYGASSTEFWLTEGNKSTPPCNTSGAIYHPPHDSYCSAYGEGPGFVPLKPNQVLTTHTTGQTRWKFLKLRRTGACSLSVPLPGLKALEKAFSTHHQATLAALFTSFYNSAQTTNFGSSLPRNSRGLKDFFR